MSVSFFKMYLLTSNTMLELQMYKIAVYSVVFPQVKINLSMKSNESRYWVCKMFGQQDTNTPSFNPQDQKVLQTGKDIEPNPSKAKDWEISSTKRTVWVPVENRNSMMTQKDESTPQTRHKGSETVHSLTPNNQCALAWQHQMSFRDTAHKTHTPSIKTTLPYPHKLWGVRQRVSVWLTRPHNPVRAHPVLVIIYRNVVSHERWSAALLPNFTLTQNKLAILHKNASVIKLSGPHLVFICSVFA